VEAAAAAGAQAGFGEESHCLSAGLAWRPSPSVRGALERGSALGNLARMCCSLQDGGRARCVCWPRHVCACACAGSRGRQEEGQ